MKLFRTKALTIWMLIMVGLVAQGQGQVPGQTCGSTFFGALVQLIPCRGAVAPFSMVQPTLACCNAIKTLGLACVSSSTALPSLALTATWRCSSLASALLTSNHVNLSLYLPVDSDSELSSWTFSFFSKFVFSNLRKK